MNLELFHFLRPWWLLAIPGLCMLLVFVWTHASSPSSWSRIVAPELLQHLLLDGAGKRSRWSLVMVAFAGTLVVLALAGPTWERIPQPVYRSEAPLVLVLDLSRSMDAADIKPSRLIRARYKLSDILRQRTEGQTALIVYAADAFTVTPLTDDTATIASQLPALTTGLVPVQGSHTGRALELAVKLLEQAGHRQGDILLITDEARQLGESLVTESPYRLSILGVGTAEGAPIPLGDGMLKDADGNIVIPGLDDNHLRELAATGGGYYATLSADDRDLDALKVINVDGQSGTQLRERDALTADRWREFGPWLLLLVLPLAVLVFRRGVLLALVVVVPLPDAAQASMWQDLWYRADQQGQQLLQQDQPAEAADRFKDPAWQATARYKAEQYEQAAQAYADLPGAEARYNQGNALAKAGELQQALDAYVEGLKLEPEHADMQHNKRLVEEILAQQQEQQSQERQNQEQQNQEQQNQEQQNQEQQSQEQQNQEQQNQEQQNQDQQNQDQQNQEQESEEQESEEQGQAREQAAEQAETEDQDPGEQQIAEPLPDDSDDQPMDEAQMAREQWLNRIPDDPAGLLRRKFQYQYSRRHRASTEQQQW